MGKNLNQSEHLGQNFCEDRLLFVPILMCGGLGLRVWPMSRNSMPKQFIKCIQIKDCDGYKSHRRHGGHNDCEVYEWHDVDEKISTFQQSVMRLFALLKMANENKSGKVCKSNELVISGVSGVSGILGGASSGKSESIGKIIVVTNRQFLFHVRHQLHEVLKIINASVTGGGLLAKMRDIIIILEPEAKNTMPTVLLGCAAAQKMGYSRVFVCTADHVVANEIDFAKDIISANNASFARKLENKDGSNGGKITIFGSKTVNDDVNEECEQTQKPRFGKIIAEAAHGQAGVLQKVIIFSEKAAAKACDGDALEESGVKKLAKKATEKFINCGLILADIDVIFEEISRIEKISRVEKTCRVEKACRVEKSGVAMKSAVKSSDSVGRECLGQVLVAQNCITNASQILHNNAAEITISEQDFAKFNAISADYSLLNNADNLMVFAASFSWKDMGSWAENAINVSAKNNPNNAENKTENSVISGAESEIITHNVSECLIKNDASGVSVVANDVKDLTIYCSSDFVFVSSRADAENAYANLKSHNTELAKKITHKAGTEYRQWGYFDIISSVDGYKVKKLTIMPQRKTSLQSHNYRSEYWLVSGGSAKIILGDEEKTVQQMGTVSVSVGQKHQIINNSETQNLTIIEIQKGEILQEEDIIRYTE